MSSGRMKVAVKLQTMIDDDGDLETITVEESGFFYENENMDVVTFHEKTEEGFSIKNMITIHSDKVRVKRTGAIQMNQQFHAGNITENLYQHAHGNIHMETYTEHIDYQRPAPQYEGRLTMSYSVKLDGQLSRDHQLLLVINKEETP